MTDLHCRDVEALLVDYVEGELADDQRADVERHMRDCTSCAAARGEFERVRNALRRDATPEPGAAFWGAFPERVWQAHRAELRGAAVRQPVGTWAQLRAVLQSILAAPRWVPVAAALALAIVTGYLAVRTPVRVPDAAAFQARIHSDANLATLARKAAVDLAPPNQFGFASTSGGVNYFRIGHWYAEALAYSAGGDADAARTRLAAMAAALRPTAPRLAELLDREPTLGNIAALEPRLLRVAQAGGEDDAALLRAGVWLTNIALAAAAGDAEALHVALRSLSPLERNLERAQIAPGARRNLHELSGVLAAETLSASDLANVRRLVRRIQTILM